MKVNGNNADSGCYIAGHHGQYGMDMLGDIVEQFGWEFGAVDSPDIDGDPRYWRRGIDAETTDDVPVVSASPNRGQRFATTDECWDRLVWASEQLEEFLNLHTTGGYWSWEDGEFFLTQTEVETEVYVPAPSYDEAWQSVMDDVGPNSRLGFFSLEDADDALDNFDEGTKIFRFITTVRYEPESDQ